MGNIKEHSVEHVETESEATIARNAKNAIYLFFVYVAFYAAFMYLSAFEPAVMATMPFGGLNLALVYGMFLIVLALILALIYMWMCKTTNDKPSN